MSSTKPEKEKNGTASEAGGEAAQGRFSLHRLSAAFARLSGAPDSKPEAPEVADSLEEVEESGVVASSVGDVVSPRMIVEGMLFVGNSEGKALTSRQLAANIRDVSPKEIDELVVELNRGYVEANAAYEVVSEGAGYRLQVRPELDAIRHRFGGKVREAKLTTSAIEVLSVVAYRQPISADEVGKLRNSSSRATLNQLVRRGLLRLDRNADSPRRPTYQTTERFNGLFQIASAAELPQSEELDDC